MAEQRSAWRFFAVASVVYAAVLVAASAAAGPLDISEYGAIETSQHLALAASVIAWAAAWARARRLAGPGDSHADPSAGFAVLAALALGRETGWLQIYGAGEAHRVVEVVSVVVCGVLLVAIVWHWLAAPGNRRDRIVGFLTSAPLRFVVAGGLLLILADGFEKHELLARDDLMEEAAELWGHLAFLMAALLSFQDANAWRHEGNAHP